MVYVGAKGARLDPRRVRPGWQIQRKHDGCYVELELDAGGRVARVTSRGGRGVGASLLGERVGAPGAVLAGELEAHTEAGASAARANPGGLPRVWIFDCLRSGGRDLSGEPYRVRRDALCRMHAELQDEDDGRGWAVDRQGQAYDPATGRWCERTERGWRRAPVVEQHPAERAADLWEEAMARGWEGLVAVDPSAPAGRGKRKIKVADELDCVVAAVDGARVVMRTFGREFLVGRCGLAVRPGQVWAVRHDGWYGTGEPRFARLTRSRTDLVG